MLRGALGFGRCLQRVTGGNSPLSLSSPSSLCLGSLLQQQQQRFLSNFSDEEIRAMPMNQWQSEFEEAACDLKAMDVDSITYKDSASRMRSLLQSRLLLHDDLKTNPERFFLAHRIIAQHAASLGPGFWVRFTVHYNLCVGTVLELGSEKHQADLKQMQNDGLLGCFGLTERHAGVSSGLVVETTATFDPASETFTLNSPNDGAAKNWISQGFVGDKIVAIADLKVGGQSYGPHAFFTELRKGGELVDGVTVGDMGRKTVGNDLDNAWIHFNNVKVPTTAMLNKFADIENGEYVQKVKGLPAFHTIGQRLFSGRVAVAQAAMEFRKSVFAGTLKYANERKCWSPQGGRALVTLPHLSSLIKENEQDTELLSNFLTKIEKELSSCLVNGKVPGLALVNGIAAAKVRVVEDSIEKVHRLQNEVGSFALMHGSGFEQRDFLTCCKFAEGDSRVLMQKMARDRMKMFVSKEEAKTDMNSWSDEQHLCYDLAAAVAKDPGAWDERWKDVYALSDMIIDRTIKEFMEN